MDLDVLFVGTAGSAPTARRALPATLIRRGGDRLLFDCGEGTQRQLIRSVGLIELDEVFVTHFHADHLLGLPGLLKTYGLMGRERPLHVYGPKGLERMFAALRPVVGRTSYEVHLRELEPGHGSTATATGSPPSRWDHGVTAVGYALIEDPRPGRFDEQRASGSASHRGPTSAGCSEESRWAK